MASELLVLYHPAGFLPEIAAFRNLIGILALTFVKKLKSENLKPTFAFVVKDKWHSAEIWGRSFKNDFSV